MINITENSGMRIIGCVLLALVVAAGVTTWRASSRIDAPIAAAPPTMDPPASPPIVHHVVVISIDGCRPDVLLRADTPTIHEMMARGSFTFYAETTDLAVTLPSHTSMMTGVVPTTHGIDFNVDPPDDQLTYPRVPTLFDIAHANGMVTALVSTKSKFRVLNRPGSVDAAAISTESSSSDDMLTAKNGAEIIDALKPNAMLVHLGNNDKVGHAAGWGTPDQLDAMHTADEGVNIVLHALDNAGIADDTLVIVSSDHGGSGATHGAGDPRSRYIPWIAVGPRVRKNYDLTRDRDLTVHTEDTFATACYFLGLPTPAHIDGKPIVQIISGRELIHSQ
jgi:predicted AlkP superfamily pyrophosphatase or phosphodiesterase